MHVRTLRTYNFRNLKDVDAGFSPGVNVLYGDNAQGKTSVLEAIWMFTGLKSFRTKNIADAYAFSSGKNECRCDVEFETADGTDRAAMVSEDSRRTFYFNGAEYSPAEALGRFNAVIFTPNTYDVINGAPERRRNYLDSLLCQYESNYGAQLAVYSRALRQRNAGLKNCSTAEEFSRLRDAWDPHLVRCGNIIMEARERLVKELSEMVAEFYGELGADEVCSVEYEPKTSGEALDAALEKNAERDLLTKTTNAGPHRDDIDIRLNGRSLKTFGSQGQRKTCALALKLAEAGVGADRRGESPVIMLDDFVGELDAGRRKFVIGACSAGQLFITCCERIPELSGAAEYVVADGTVSRQE
ncbi:MAG: DNA replication and repair protein RecF [Clostridia bacterium]|nr:DNA replication and repair protein RecF [Clostridia bacterium]